MRLTLFLLVLMLLFACGDQSATPKATSDEPSPAKLLERTPEASATTPDENERRSARKARAAVRQARKEAQKTQAAAEAPLSGTVESLFALYNAENFVQASAHVADKFLTKCGGPTNLAFAFAQNKDSERLNYSLDALKVTDVSGRKAQADVTYSARDVETGELVDDHFAVGLAFVRNTRRETGWVLNDLFPVGVSAYC